MSRAVPKLHAVALVVLGLLVGGTMCALAARGVEPMATWLYPFVWYPLLLAIEGGVALRHGRFLLLHDRRLLASVLAWSVPLWMLWELLNFRLENWHYVFVPDRRAALWTGVVLSFATVLPACFLPAALVWPRSGMHDGPPAEPAPPRRLAGSALGGLRLAGLAMLALPLLWPRLFFPLVWGGFFLLVEPDLYRRAPSRSLLADVLESRFRRPGALLAGGALAGLTWEALNAVARGAWIYTVPFFDELKIFEMPILGFLGFPPLALSCFSLFQWLGLRGWARPLSLDPTAGSTPHASDSGEARLREASGSPQHPRSGALLHLSAAALVVLTLLGMEVWTISSRTPRLRDLPGLLPSDVETLRVWGVDSPFALAERTPRGLAEEVPGVRQDEARSWIDVARLATLRGMGTRNARILHLRGIDSPEALARADPASLDRCFQSYGSRGGVRPARVRVWWRGARSETGIEGPPETDAPCGGDPLS